LHFASFASFCLKNLKAGAGRLVLVFHFSVWMLNAVFKTLNMALKLLFFENFLCRNQNKEESI